MRARSSNWLLLSLVVLSALVAAELRFEVGTSPGGQALGQASAPLEATPVPVPLFALADRESFSQTLTRPLFMPNRQPPSAASAPEQVPRATAPPKANRYALSAIIIVGGERVALLTDTATGGLNRVREGESIAGWRVEKIHENRAVLSNGDTREELSLRTFGPPAPRPKSPARRTRSQRQKAAQLPGKNQGESQKRLRRPKREPRQALRNPETEAD